MLLLSCHIIIIKIEESLYIHDFMDLKNAMLIMTTCVITYCMCVGSCPTAHENEWLDTGMPVTDV